MKDTNAERILASLKNEIEETLIFLAQTDMDINGHITNEVVECFETQKVPFPDELKRYALKYENIPFCNYVECKKCGGCEEIPADQKRIDLRGSFDLVDYPEDRGEEDDGTAFYKCMKCGEVSRSQILPENEEDEV